MFTMPHPVRPTRLRILLLVGLAGGLWTLIAFTARQHDFFDLRVYHGALTSWVHEGGSLYGYSVPDSVFGFTYPPFAAVVLLPLAVVSWPVAVALSVVVNVAATAAVLYLLVEPVARRQGWDPRFAVALAVVVAPAFEPFLETLLFGQVNLLLVLLATVDLLLLVPRGSRFAGTGIGLAAAIKLTPAIFILYLLVTRRWRAAVVASATAVLATAFAAAVAPGTSREFWTGALWHTGRVGDLDFISNQSLLGAMARWNPEHPATVVAIVLGLAAAGVWFVRVRRAYAARGVDRKGRVAGGAEDELTGFALTGVLGCLISPFTWIHHLVWLTPALVLLAEQVLTSWRNWRERWLLFGTAGLAVIVLCTRVVWRFHNHYANLIGWLGSNGYLYLTIALLFVLPVRQPAESPTHRSGTSENAAPARA